MFGKDICVTPPSGGNEINNVGNPCTDTFGTGQCEVCTGDCDNDGDCAGSMRCAQRGRSDGLENVPGEFLKYHSSSGKDCISFKSISNIFLSQDVHGLPTLTNGAWAVRTIASYPLMRQEPSIT